MPDRCGTGTFCPDEESECLPQLAVGSACQFNRDGAYSFIFRACMY